jgi:hypothetical protein
VSTGGSAFSDRPRSRGQGTQEEENRQEQEHRGSRETERLPWAAAIGTSIRRQNPPQNPASLAEPDRPLAAPTKLYAGPRSSRPCRSSGQSRKAGAAIRERAGTCKETHVRGGRCISLCPTRTDFPRAPKGSGIRPPDRRGSGSSYRAGKDPPRVRCVHRITHGGSARRFNEDPEFRPLGPPAVRSALQYGGRPAPSASD